MRSARVRRTTTVLLSTALLSSSLAAASHPLRVQPSGNFFGIDGNWSSFSLTVGNPRQHVELTVSTALSEIWVIGTGGCSAANLCKTARGGLFDASASSSWDPLGPWELGLADLGSGGNGDYGLETVSLTGAPKHSSTTVDGALVAAINDTDYYQGFVGVGVTQSRFGKNVSDPIITQLAQTYGTIPSHSYGYTAGAHYRNMPASLTLGGYDELRLDDSDVQFHLDQNTRIPSVNLRAISAAVSASSSSLPLLAANESLPAIIDSSTPYLWLPRSVCDRFADALNLTWSDQFGVYLFDPDGSQFADFQKLDSHLSLTFSISSYDNNDDYGDPLAVPGLVNITVPAAAFAQLLRYPFRDAISFDKSSVPYFPLKRAAQGGPYVIGRAFMQEVYLLMDYDRGQFSLHQALFPENPATNYSLAAVPRPPDSPYPAYTGGSGGSGGGLSTGQTAGIAIGAFAVGSVLALSLWCCCRRRRRAEKRRQLRRLDDDVDDKHGSESGDSDHPPMSPVERMLSILTGRKPRSSTSKKQRQPPPATLHEVHGSHTQPVEVGADANHEVYELPVPLTPVELDGNTLDEGAIDADLLATTADAHGLSPYEVAQLRIDKQLQGPLPEYTERGPTEPPNENEKADHQDRDVASPPPPRYRPDAGDPSPASSPTYANSNSLPYSLPSPLSPYNTASTGRQFDLPSPLTNPSNFSGSTFDPAGSTSHPAPPSSLSRSASSTDQSVSSPTAISPAVGPPEPAFQRAPIDPSRVVCLGPLPENVQLPNQQQRPPLPASHQRPSIPQLITRNPRAAASQSSPPPPSPTRVSPANSPSPPQSPGPDDHDGRRRSTDTLGSNFTVEEENRMRDGQPVSSSSSSASSPRSPDSMGRIDAGSELIHVPQLAERRYSWEEDQQ